MRTFDKAVVVSLMLFALLAAVFGVGTIVHAYNTTKPGFKRLQDHAKQALQVAEEAVEVLDEHPERMRQLGAPRDSLVESASNVHFVVQQTAKVSLQAADALDATAQSLESIPTTSELFLPEDKLANNADHLTETADALRHLGPRLESLEKSTRQLSEATSNSAQAASQIEDEWVEADVTLTRLADLLEEARIALDEANPALGATRQVSLIGGIYLLLSVVLLGMAGMWKRLCDLTPISQTSLRGDDH